MARWMFADGRHARAFRVCSMVVVAGALMGAATGNAWVDPAGEWADEIRYLIVAVFALAAWVFANHLHYRATAVGTARG